MLCPLSRRQQRRVETRERLLDTALRLFSERDFDAVTVEMITEAAVVGKGTFFNYFANKEAIVAYLFESHLQLLQEIVELPVESLPVVPPRATIEKRCAGLKVGGPVWRQIVAITHLMAERDGASKRLQRTLLSLSLTNDAVRAANLSIRRRVVAVGGELVRAGQASGEFRDDLSVEALTDFLVHIYSSALYAWAQSDTDESFHAALDRAYTLAWGGVCPPGDRQKMEAKRRHDASRS